MELQQNLAAIRKQGLGVAAISYDSIGVLKSFADRQHIAYPLLSDTDSKIIRAFDILNETATPGTLTYGIPYPGVYIVDVQGKVVSKYFEDDYKDRVSTADILARQYGTPLAEAKSVRETAHLTLTTAASNHLARPGLRIALILDIVLKPGMHLYAPGVQGYIPIDWKLEDGGPAAKRHPFKYPPSEMLRLEAIGETVPVYRGHVKIVREITFGQEDALKPLVTSAGELIIKGSFRYQACDDRKCYLPQDLPLEWRFPYQGLDRERAPAEFQRKPNWLEKVMSGVVYRSEVRIERVKGPVRKAYLPAESEPVIFGVHGAVAEHYKVSPTIAEPRATTLDYIVAAAAGWLTGTFGGALEARQISASTGRLVGEAMGEIELEENVLVIRRIHVRMRLKTEEANRETATRVHGIFADHCPVYRSLKPAIAMTTELIFEPLAE